MKPSYLVLGVFVILAVLFTASNAYRIDDWMIAPIANNNKASYLFGEVICPEVGCKNLDVLTFDLKAFKGHVDFTSFTLDIFLPDGTVVMKHDKPHELKDDKITFVMNFDKQESYPHKTELDFLVVALYERVDSKAVGKLFPFNMTYNVKGSGDLPINVDYDWEVVQGAAKGHTALQLPIHKGKQADGIIHDFYFSIDEILTDSSLFRVELLGPGTFKINEEEGCQINDVEVDVTIDEKSSGKILYIDTDGEPFTAGSFIVTDCLRIQYAAPTPDVAGLPVNFAIHLLEGNMEKSTVRSAAVIPAKFIPEEHVPDLTTNMFLDANSISCYFGIRFLSNSVVHKDDYVSLTIKGVKGLDKEVALVRSGTNKKLFKASQVQSKDGVYDNIRIEMPDSEKKVEDMFGVAFHIPADLKSYGNKDEVSCRFRYSHSDGNERMVFDDSMTDIRYHDLSEKAEMIHTKVNKRKLSFSYSFEKTAPTSFTKFLFMTPLLEYVYSGDFKTCTINGKKVTAVNDFDGKDTSEGTSVIRVTPEEPVPEKTNFKFECPDVHLILPDTYGDDVAYNKQLITVYAYGKYIDENKEEQEDQWVTSHYFYANEDGKKDGKSSKTFVYILIGVAVIAVIAAIAFFIIRRKRADTRQQDMGVGLLDDAA